MNLSVLKAGDEVAYLYGYTRDPEIRKVLRATKTQISVLSPTAANPERTEKFNAATGRQVGVSGYGASFIRIPTDDDRTRALRCRVKLRVEALARSLSGASIERLRAIIAALDALEGAP